MEKYTIDLFTFLFIYASLSLSIYLSIYLSIFVVVVVGARARVGSCPFFQLLQLDQLSIDYVNIKIFNKCVSETCTHPLALQVVDRTWAEQTNQILLKKNWTKLQQRWQVKDRALLQAKVGGDTMEDSRLVELPRLGHFF